ncbi:MAG TPA: hypothetical protein VN706_22735 [Gemmatimonadaceae bacterium]|nr:hypothetical protein [Gemmatimonadaceae bacterium]
MEFASLEPTPSDADGLSANRSTISHRIDRAHRLVHITLAGDVDSDALYAACERLFADPGFTRGMDVCIECRILTSIPADEQIRALALSALLHRAQQRVGRVAIVATTARGHEAASVFELFADAPEFRLAVFSDATAAREWLGITSS